MYSGVFVVDLQTERWKESHKDGQKDKLTVADECLRLLCPFRLIPTSSSSGSSGVPGRTRLEEVLLFDEVPVVYRENKYN